MHYTSREDLGGDYTAREYMKYIILLISVVTLLTTAGCIFPGHRGGGEDRGRGEYREHSEHHDDRGPEVVVRVRPD
jgi:hypothetical protein